MTEGRDRFTWSVTSTLMALIANCHTDGKAQYDPDDFNPTLTKQERHRGAILITDENVDLMRGEFKKAFK
jgi:hypothetical protein